jgi:hypothetical protein
LRRQGIRPHDGRVSEDIVRRDELHAAIEARGDRGGHDQAEAYDRARRRSMHNTGEPAQRSRAGKDEHHQQLGPAKKAQFENCIKNLPRVPLTISVSGVNCIEETNESGRTSRT